MSRVKVVDIGALADASKYPRVSLGGVEYAVHPLTVGGAQSIAAAQEAADDTAMAAAIITAGRHAVPDMPADVFDRLTIEQVLSVVAISREGADAVEALLAERAKQQAEADAGN